MESNNTSLPIKEFLIREIVRNKNVINDKIIPENVISAVITHQFESASLAIPHNNSVEISGFGKFVFNQARAHKKMAGYEIALDRYRIRIDQDDVSPHERRNLQMRITSIMSSMKALKPKIKNDE